MFAGMLLAALAAAGTAPARAPEAFPLERSGPYLIVSKVYVNGSGPFRLLLDTGAQSTALSEARAAELGIAPAGWVEVVTIAGSRRAPAGRARTVAVGEGERAAAENLEVLIGNVDAVLRHDRRVEGVLGHNFLRGRDYLLDYAARTLMLDPDPASVRGEAVPFRIRQGRIVIDAGVDGRVRTLVLDSGTPSLVLFGAVERRAPALGNALLSTNAGASPAGLGHENVRIGRSISKILPAALLPGDPRRDGLLPTSIFRSIYVNWAGRYVVLEAK